MAITTVGKTVREIDLQFKVLVGIFILLVAVSVTVSFLRFFVWREYPIESQIDCDPYTEACFVYHCNPAAEECTGDPELDTSYYKLFTREASSIPLCDPTDETCSAFVCAVGEAGCFITYCGEADAEEGLECSNPEVYRAEHPTVDESGEEAMSDPDQSVSSGEVDLEN